MRKPLIELCGKIGYTFSDEVLLETALSHRSVRGYNNERLEFLGDSIINFIIAEALYKQRPQSSEGELSRLRANLVKGQTLAELAQNFQLGHYLRLGSGELKSGGHRRESILADAYEAMIAAIYLDSGLDACRQCVLRWYEKKLDDISHIEVEKDPKSQLQEYLQARKLPLPEYKVERVEGEAHQQIFYVSCKTHLVIDVAHARGTSRRKAEQAAAEMVLSKLAEAENAE